MYENGSKNRNRALSGRFFFSPETISKDDDIKIEREISPFSPALPVDLPLLAVLSLFFTLLRGFFGGLKEY